MHNILIVGLGNIGLRHLQSLKKYKQKLNFFLVDKNLKNLIDIKKKYSKSIHSFYIYDKIIELNKKINLLIISTNSENRYEVCKDVISKNTIKNIILEKVVTSDLSKYKKLIKIIKIKKIKCYINFPRRELDFYKKLKNSISNKNKITIIVNYKKINLGSNLIHYIDLFQYLKDSKEFYLLKNNLHKRVYRSKRKGFMEFKGSLIIKNDFDDKIIINETNSMNEYLMIQINNKCYIIFDNYNYFINFNLNDSKFIIKPYNELLQSQLTLKYFKKILNNSYLNLTSLESAFYSHQIIINTFNKHLKKLSEKRKLLIT